MRSHFPVSAYTCESTYNLICCYTKCRLSLYTTSVLALKTCLSLHNRNRFTQVVKWEEWVKLYLPHVNIALTVLMNLGVSVMLTPRGPLHNCKPHFWNFHLRNFWCIFLKKICTKNIKIYSIWLRYLHIRNTFLTF